MKKYTVLILLLVLIFGTSPISAYDNNDEIEKASARAATTLVTFNKSAEKTFTGVDTNGDDATATIKVSVSGNYLYTASTTPTYSDVEITSASRSVSNVQSYYFYSTIVSKSYKVKSNKLYICVTIEYGFGRSYATYTYEIQV